MATLGLDKSGYEKGLDDAEQSGRNFSGRLASAMGTAGRVAGIAFTAIATGAGAVTNEFRKGVAETAAYGDHIDKTSQKIGISAEAYQEWDFIMQHAGASVDSMQASMRILTNVAMTNADAFTAVGLSVEDVASMSREDLFAATIEGLQGITDESERAVVANQLLGRGATELGALLNMTSEDVQKMRQQAHDLGGVMSDEAVTAAATYQDSIQDLHVAMDSFKRNLTSEFLPAFSTVADGLTAIFSGDGSGVEKITEGINSIVETITNNLPQVLAAGSKIVFGLLDAISKNAPQIVATGGQVVLQLAQGIIRRLPQILQTVSRIIMSLASEIGEQLPTLLPTIVEAVVTVARTLVENLPQLLSAVLEVITGLAQGIIDALPILLEALPELIVGVVNFILGAIPQIIEAVISIVDGIVEALPTIIQMIVQMIPQIIQGVIFAILDHLPDIIEAGIELLGSLLSNTPVIIMEIVKAIPKIIMGIIEALTSPEMIQKLMDTGGKLLEKLMSGLTDFGTRIWDACKKIFDAISRAASDMWEGIKKIGNNVVEGIWEGIKGRADWIWNKVKEWFGGLFSKIKDFLGIASPSKLFRDVIGKNLVLGLAEGIDDNADTAVGSMLDLADELVQAADIGDVTYRAAIAGSKTMGGGDARKWNIVQNVYAYEMSPVEAFEAAQQAAQTAEYLGLA
jgi:phage-related protein